MLGGTLLLYATGAVLVAGVQWATVLGALVACGFPLGVLAVGRGWGAEEVASWSVYLGTATLAAVVAMRCATGRRWPRCAGSQSWRPSGSARGTWWSLSSG